MADITPAACNPQKTFSESPFYKYDMEAPVFLKSLSREFQYTTMGADSQACLPLR